MKQFQESSSRAYYIEETLENKEGLTIDPISSFSPKKQFEGKSLIERRIFKKGKLNDLNINNDHLSIASFSSFHNIPGSSDSYYNAAADYELEHESPPTPPKYVPPLTKVSPFLIRLRHISSVPIPLNTTSKSLFTLKEFILQKIFVHNLDLHEFFKNKIETSFNEGKVEFSKAMSYHLNIDASYNEWKYALYSLYDEIQNEHGLDFENKEIVHHFENSINERKEAKDFKIKILRLLDEISVEKHETPELRLKYMFEEFAENGMISQKKKVRKLKHSDSSSLYRKSNELFVSMKKSQTFESPQSKNKKNSSTIHKSPSHSKLQSLDKKIDEEALLGQTTSDKKLNFHNFQSGLRDLYGKEWNTNHDVLIKQFFAAEAMSHIEHRDGSESGRTRSTSMSHEDIPFRYDSSIKINGPVEILRKSYESSTPRLNSPNSVYSSGISSNQLQTMTIDFQEFSNIFIHLLQLIMDREKIQEFKDRLMNALNLTNMTTHDLFRSLDKEKLEEIDLLSFKEGIKNEMKIFNSSDYISCDVDSLLIDWFLSMDVEGTGEVNEEYFEANLCDIDIIPLLKRKIRAYSQDLELLFTKEFNGDLGTCTFKDFKKGCHSIGIKASVHVLRILFNQIDEDASESISLKEFVDAIGYDHSRLNALKEIILHKVYSLNISMQDLFERIDKDKRGYITENDLRWSFRNMLNLNIPDKIIEELLKLMDPQRNNRILYHDFNLCISDQLDILSTKQRILMEAERRGDSILDLFSRFDYDKSGDLSMEELKLGLRVYCSIECDGESLNNLFSSMDLDGNGICELVEFESIHRDIQLINLMRFRVESLKYSLLDNILLNVNIKKSKITVEIIKNILKKLYNSMDHTGSNAIDYYSLRDIFEQRFGMFEEEISLRLLFEEMDTYAQGYVSQDEFVNSMAQFFELKELVDGLLLQGSTEKVFYQYFDLEGKGSISFDAFSRCLSRILTVTSCRKQVQQLFFNKADSSGKGYITLSEFQNVCKKDWTTFNNFPFGIPSKKSKKLLKLSKQSTYYSEILKKLNQGRLVFPTYIPKHLHFLIDGNQAKEVIEPTDEFSTHRDNEQVYLKKLKESNQLNRSKLNDNMISEYELETNIVNLFGLNEKLNTENRELKHLTEHLVKLHRLKYAQSI